jgi:hypothetical protein
MSSLVAWSRTCCLQFRKLVAARAALVSVCTALVAGCAGDGGRGSLEPVAPHTTREFPGAVVFASHDSIEAILIGRDTISPLARTIREARLRFGQPPTPAFEETPVSEESVTESGLATFNTHTRITYDGGGKYTGLWDSETRVLAGFAYRVYLLTQGSYDSETNPTKRFSNVCGSAWWELLKQSCTLADMYLDMNCFPRVDGTRSSRSIFAQSQHAATFRATTLLKTTSAVATCPPPNALPKTVALQGPSTVGVGQWAALTATATYLNGAPATEVCPPFSWSSNNPGVGFVDSDGRVSGIAPGSVTITAACGSASARRDLNVVGCSVGSDPGAQEEFRAPATATGIRLSTARMVAARPTLRAGLRPQADIDPCAGQIPDGGGVGDPPPPLPPDGGDPGFEVCFDVLRLETVYWAEYDQLDIYYYYDHTECYWVMNRIPRGDARLSMNILAAGGGTLGAQQAEKSKATIVIVDSLPGRRPFAIVPAEQSVRALILTDASRITAADLDFALRIAASRQAPTDATQTFAFIPKQPSPVLSDVARDVAARGILEALRRAGKVDVAGLGRARAITVDLPTRTPAQP